MLNPTPLNITNITMSKVQTIGESAFGSSEFVSVNLGGSLTSIGDHAFDYARKLTSIVIPDTVAYLGRYAFNYCEKMTSVNIPKGISAVG